MALVSDNGKKCYNNADENSHPLMPRKTTRKSAARAPRPAARSSAEGMSARLSAWVNRNPYSAAVALLFAFAAYLALNNLNYVGFWDDEAASAILSRNFLEFGVPTAWDGRNLWGFRDGRALDEDNVVRYPRMIFYLGAAMFSVFGAYDWAGRLGTALVGLAAFFLLVGILRMEFPSRPRVRLVALALFALSPVYLLHIRQFQYYSLSLTCALGMFWAWRRYVERREWWTPLALLAFALGAFHANFLLGATFVAALAVYHCLFYFRAFRPREWLLFAGLGLAWLAACGGYFYAEGYHEGYGQLNYRVPWWKRKPWLFLLHIRELNSEDYITWPFGLWLAWAAARAARARLWLSRQKPARKIEKEIAAAAENHVALRLTAFCFILLCFVAIGTVQGWPLGYADSRYLLSSLPFFAAVCACAIDELWRLNRLLAGAVLALTLTTNMMGEPFLTFKPRHFEWRVTLPAFIYETHSKPPHPHRRVVNYLREHAKPNDLVFAMHTSGPREHKHVMYPLMWYLGDVVLFCCQFNPHAAELARRSQATPDEVARVEGILERVRGMNGWSLDDGTVFPDWFIAFVRPSERRMGLLRREFMVDGRRVRYEYREVANLDIHPDANVFRPEYYAHIFGGRARFNPERSSVYVYKREGPFEVKE